MNASVATRGNKTTNQGKFIPETVFGLSEEEEEEEEESDEQGNLNIEWSEAGPRVEKKASEGSEEHDPGEDSDYKEGNDTQRSSSISKSALASRNAGERSERTEGCEESDGSTKGLARAEQAGSGADDEGDDESDDADSLYDDDEENLESSIKVSSIAGVEPFVPGSVRAVDESISSIYITFYPP